VRRTNLLRHGSLNVSRKSVLVICYVLFLLVRVLAIVSAIFIPVIKEAGVFVANEGIDASDWFDDQDFRLEFQHFFRKALDAITTDIRKNVNNIPVSPFDVSGLSCHISLHQVWQKYDEGTFYPPCDLLLAANALPHHQRG